VTALLDHAARLRDQLVALLPVSFDVSSSSVLRLADGTPAGAVDVWRGGPVRALVSVTLNVPGQGVEGALLHALAEPDSPIPHLTSDLALADGDIAFGCDLLPRVEAPVDPDWYEEVYAGLDQVRAGLGSAPSLSGLPVPLRLRALSSPWLVAARVAPDDYAVAEQVLSAYGGRFAECVHEPPPSLVEAADLAARDSAHLRALFDEATDPVWGSFGSLVGPGARDSVLGLLRHS